MLVDLGDDHQSRPLSLLLRLTALWQVTIPEVP
eukprot:SAG25_NODE_9849_length_355_cov_1.187500_1_plen_32_part_10